jgi:hypothetical protein
MSDLYEIENEIPFDKISFDNLGLKTAKIKDLIKIDYLTHSPSSISSKKYFKVILYEL